MRLCKDSGGCIGCFRAEFGHPWHRLQRAFSAASRFGWLSFGAEDMDWNPCLQNSRKCCGTGLDGNTALAKPLRMPWDGTSVDAKPS